MASKIHHSIDFRGTSTGSAIHFENVYAVSRLVELYEWRGIKNIIVGGKEFVEDVTVEYANGIKEHCQVKHQLASGKNWTASRIDDERVWNRFAEIHLDYPNDRFTFVSNGPADGELVGWLKSKFARVYEDVKRGGHFTDTEQNYLNKIQQYTKLPDINATLRFLEKFSLELSYPDSPWQRREAIHRLLLLSLTETQFHDIYNYVAENCHFRPDVDVNKLDEIVGGRISKFLDDFLKPQTFPEPIFIERTELFDDIDKCINEASSGYILIECAPGSGKSRTLAEYCKSKDAICCPLQEERGASPQATQPQVFVRSLYRALAQKYGMTTEERDETPHPELSVNELYTRLSVIGPHLERRGSKLLIGVDGLDAAPPDFQDQIFRELPSNVFFIIASRPGYFRKRSQLVGESIGITRFTPKETERYLQDCEFDRRTVERIHQLSEGLPLYLYYVQSEYNTSGEEIETILSRLPQGLSNYYRRLLESLPEDALTLKALAVIACAQKPLRTTQIADILSVDQIDLNLALDKVRYLLNSGQFVTFYHSSLLDEFTQYFHFHEALQQIHQKLAEYAFKEQSYRIFYGYHILEGFPQDGLSRLYKTFMQTLKRPPRRGPLRLRHDGMALIKEYAKRGNIFPVLKIGAILNCLEKDGRRFYPEVYLRERCEVGDWGAAFREVENLSHQPDRQQDMLETILASCLWGGALGWTEEALAKSLQNLDRIPSLPERERHFARIVEQVESAVERGNAPVELLRFLKRSPRMQLSQIQDVMHSWQEKELPEISDVNETLSALRNVALAPERFIGSLRFILQFGDKFPEEAAQVVSALPNDLDDIETPLEATIAAYLAFVHLPESYADTKKVIWARALAAVKRITESWDFVRVAQNVIGMTSEFENANNLREKLLDPLFKQVRALPDKQDRVTTLIELQSLCVEADVHCDETFLDQIIGEICADEDIRLIDFRWIVIPTLPDYLTLSDYLDKSKQTINRSNLKMLIDKAVTLEANEMESGDWLDIAEKFSEWCLKHDMEMLSYLFDKLHTIQAERFQTADQRALLFESLVRKLHKLSLDAVKLALEHGLSEARTISDVRDKCLRLTQLAQAAFEHCKQPPDALLAECTDEIVTAVDDDETFLNASRTVLSTIVALKPGNLLALGNRFAELFASSNPPPYLSRDAERCADSLNKLSQCITADTEEEVSLRTRLAEISQRIIDIYAPLYFPRGSSIETDFTRRARIFLSKEFWKFHRAVAEIAGGIAKKAPKRALELMRDYPEVMNIGWATLRNICCLIVHFAREHAFDETVRFVNGITWRDTQFECLLMLCDTATKICPGRLPELFEQAGSIAHHMPKKHIMNRDYDQPSVFAELYRRSVIYQLCSEEQRMSYRQRIDSPNLLCNTLAFIAEEQHKNKREWKPFLHEAVVTYEQIKDESELIHAGGVLTKVCEAIGSDIQTAADALPHTNIGAVLQRHALVATQETTFAGIIEMLQEATELDVAQRLLRMLYSLRMIHKLKEITQEQAEQLAQDFEAAARQCSDRWLTKQLLADVAPALIPYVPSTIKEWFERYEMNNLLLSIISRMPPDVAQRMVTWIEGLIIGHQTGRFHARSRIEYEIKDWFALAGKVGEVDREFGRKITCKAWAYTLEHYDARVLDIFEQSAHTLASLYEPDEVWQCLVSIVDGYAAVN